MILIGESSLWVALLIAAWTAIVSYVGGARGRVELVASGERGIYATFALLLIATASLLGALLTHDFSVRYVASFTTANLPAVYVLAAFWAGRPGSFLLLAVLLAACATVAVHVSRERGGGPNPYATGTLGAVMVVILAAIATGANPFDRLDWVPPEGQGLHPRLQHLGMIVHPPTLYLGYAASAVPFALAAAALVSRRLTSARLSAMKLWVVVAWFFGAAGMLTGMWWDYTEAGFGRTWVRQPFDNASLLPWLVNTAFLFLAAAEERQGIPRRIPVLLALAAFPFAMFALSVTGSGSAGRAVQSPLDLWSGALVAVLIVVAAVLVARRLPHLRSPATSVMTGRSRLRYAGYLTHVGAVLLFAASAGLAFQSSHAVTVRTGEGVELRDPYGRDWTFVGEGLSSYQVLNRYVTALSVAAYREDTRVGAIRSEMRQYFDSRGAPAFEPVTTPGVVGSLRQDVYGVLDDLAGEDVAELRISFNPLVRWIWFGGALLALGGLFSAWPQPPPAGIEP